MERYFLEVSYLGTSFQGFQKQDNASTIQGEVENALRVLFKHEIYLTGSSRTDAGVHAKQNFFHFDTDIELSLKHMYNLNAILPADIGVNRLFAVPAEAHCRFDAIARRYRYTIYSQKDPFLKDRGYYVPYPLNRDLLEQAAALLTGEHDFSSFSKRNTQVNNFYCTVKQARWFLQDQQLIFEVEANRFLRGMVRAMVATMLKVGRGQLTLQQLSAILAAQDCTKAFFNAPGHGLSLEQVIFPYELKPLC